MHAEATIHLHRIDPARNMARFYRLSMGPSLFGDVCLVREWGRIGTSGRVRIDFYRDEGEATKAHDALTRAKRKRGYRDLAGIA